MYLGNAWLLAFVCLVLGGCAVAAMPAPQALIPKGAAATPREPANGETSRLGPPSLGGLGQRRVDRALGANVTPTRY